MDHNWQVVAVVGPTASGKTELAELLSLELGGEVVTADSMQVYRGMDIGTAKLPHADRRVPHHCLDLVDPGFAYSAALYQRDSRSVIDALLESELVPVLCGGTGLYVRAALDVMEFPSGESISPLRQELEADAVRLGPHELHARLEAIDPISAALIHPNNVRRTIRALEMAAEGACYADQAASFSRREAYYDARYIGLSMPRERLYARIDERVDQMFQAGLLEEVQRLLDAGLRDALTAQQAIGYKEFVPVVERGTDVDEAIDSVKRATRRYAKRQLTWFRADPRVHWIDVEETGMASIVTRALELLASNDTPKTPQGLED